MRHDFRRSRWGHNMEAEMDSNLLKGFAWSSPRIQLWDEIVWTTAYGHAVGKVIHVKPYHDPPDMVRFFAEVVERHLSEETKQKIASGEVDSPPWLVVD